MRLVAKMKHIVYSGINCVTGSRFTPNTIIQYWDSESVPEDVALLISTWRSRNPEFSHILFNRQTATKFLQAHFEEKIVSEFQSAALPAMRSDIFRVAYILTKGGTYIDAATECKKSVKSLVLRKRHLTLMRKWHGGVWNGFVSSPKNNTVMRAIWEKILSNLEMKTDGNVWSATGPGSYIATLENIELLNRVNMIEQKEILQWFDLVNDLHHKKNDHWSLKQKTLNIYDGKPQ